MINHPVFVSLLFLFMGFLPAVAGTVITMKVFERLRVFHVKTYYQLGAPEYAKLQRWFTPLRKQWWGFLTSKDYLLLNDARLTRLCRVYIFFEWYSRFLSTVVIICLGYALYGNHFVS
jgi:hypothetical protein